MHGRSAGRLQSMSWSACHAPMMGARGFIGGPRLAAQCVLRRRSWTDGPAFRARAGGVGSQDAQALKAKVRFRGAIRHSIHSIQHALLWLRSAMVAMVGRLLAWDPRHVACGACAVRACLQIVAAVNGSTADWKLVVGHHPIHSFGTHCQVRPPGPPADAHALHAAFAPPAPSPVP